MELKMIKQGMILLQLSCSFNGDEYPLVYMKKVDPYENNMYHKHFFKKYECKKTGNGDLDIVRYNLTDENICNGDILEYKGFKFFLWLGEVYKLPYLFRLPEKEYRFDLRKSSLIYRFNEHKFRI